MDLQETSPKKRKRKISNADEPTKSKQKKVKEENLTNVKSYDIDREWTDYQLLAELQNLNIHVAEQVVKLFEDGNTIPFIARYRRDATDNMSAERLRDVKEIYDKILALKAKSQTVLNNLEKSGNLNPVLQKAILNARTMEELEHIYAPYKPGGKRTLAEKAKAAGLEEPALTLLENSKPVNLKNYIDINKKELSSIEEVEKGVMHIIAHVIATDTEVLSYLRKMRIESYFIIETKKISSKKETAKTKLKTTEEDERKYESYYDFKSNSNNIKPHQILAVNRGESCKVLTVKVTVPDFIYGSFKQFCNQKFTRRGIYNEVRKKILVAAIDDAYTRLVQPLIIREVRSELKSKAEKASLDVFSTNLKQILLAKPTKGRTILGIDPGFSNGCKLAVISSTGSVLQTAVVYPHRNKCKSSEDANTIRRILNDHNCSLIALGNGTACRETESWLSELIQNNFFAPLEVVYTIVDENGASIYSCSPEAKKEFSDLDPNLISAVSLARRVQEPLAELVKVEPKHLGVGMYQHDLSKKQLEEALNEVVTECVSFVGVDLNTASQCLLRRIAGLTDKRATNIISYREQNGPFINRLQLKEVKGIGPKVFEQCAGFLRVGPIDPNKSDEFYKSKKTTKLDCTYIHPESYDACKKILAKFNLNISNIGKPDFITDVQIKKNNLDISKFSEEVNATKESVNLILDCLSKPLNYDLRSELDQTPLFKKGLTNIYDLKAGSVLTGRITNTTHFGCFVDIGVGTNGLIHSSKMRGFNLGIGDKVEVTVLNVDTDRKRIGLEVNRKL